VLGFSMGGGGVVLGVVKVEISGSGASQWLLFKSVYQCRVSSASLPVEEGSSCEVDLCCSTLLR